MDKWWECDEIVNIKKDPPTDKSKAPYEIHAALAMSHRSLAVCYPDSDSNQVIPRLAWAVPAALSVVPVILFGAVLWVAPPVLVAAVLGDVPIVVAGMTAAVTARQSAEHAVSLVVVP